MADALLADPAPQAGPAAGDRSPWITVGVVLVGTYAFALNSTLPGMALPSIAEDIGTSGVFDVDWVITTFLAGVVFVQPVTGWLADRMGRRFVLVVSLVLFALGALVCAAAPTLEALLVGRLIQGVGGGAIIPVGKAVIWDMFPPEKRGRALSAWGMAVMAAPAAGPPIGGWVITQSSWRWIFVVLAAVAVVGAIFYYRLIPDVGYRDDRALDVAGCVLAVAAVSIVVLGARQVTTWGMGSPLTLGSGVLACGLLLALVVRSNRHPAPIIEFGMFTRPMFSLAIGVATIMGVAQFARVNFLAIELQVVRDLDAQTAGALLAPGAIAVSVAMPLGGLLVDRVGTRLPATVGVALIAVSMFMFGNLEPDGSNAGVIVPLIIEGVGMGLSSIPVSVAALNALPARFVAPANAVESLSRQLSGAVGMAVLSAIIVADVGAVTPDGVAPQAAQAAYNNVFVIAGFTTVAGLVGCLFLPGIRHTRALRSKWVAEAVL